MMIVHRRVTLSPRQFYPTPGRTWDGVTYLRTAARDGLLAEGCGAAVRFLGEVSWRASRGGGLASLFYTFLSLYFPSSLDHQGQLLPAFPEFFPFREAVA